LVFSMRLFIHKFHRAQASTFTQPLLTRCNASVTSIAMDDQARKGAKQQSAGPAQPIVAKKHRLTPNQIVAINVEEAREQKRWTQFQAVRELARFGLHWSRANYAMAVAASATGKRIREFNADEIVAFAQAFGVSIWRLFVPPPGKAVVVALPGAGQELDFEAMYNLAGARAAPIPPRNKKEARLQEEMLWRLAAHILDYMGSRLGGSDPSLTPSDIHALGEQLAQIAGTDPKKGGRR
jgi:hypothetical protein